MRDRWRALLYPAAVGAICLAGSTGSQRAAGVPSARLVSAPRLTLPGKVDSNTPAVWSLVDGSWQLVAITSFAGIPGLSVGPRLESLSPPDPVAIINHPGHGVWMESIVEDEGGVWYGYYHHEVPADACGRPDRQIPTIGALRSPDRGRTWEHLGIVIEAPADSLACSSSNRYVMGGVGDVSAALDRERGELVLFFTQYAREPRHQGVAIGRMTWGDRDAPVGKIAIWQDGAWIPARRVDSEDPNAPPSWVYPLGTPLVPATRSWHDGVATADAYWGASVHWNTYLEQWVMLVNRARDEQFNQDGLYVAFSETLSDPHAWSPPRELLNGGGWYPQVIGLEPGTGTDARAGRQARFFVTGRSDHLIEFSR
jgi:hypothetical protein